MPEFKAFIRNVYGKQLAYPANETAAKFAILLGVKTFNAHQLHQIQDLGYTMVQVTDPLTTINGVM